MEVLINVYKGREVPVELQFWCSKQEAMYIVAVYVAYVPHG